MPYSFLAIWLFSMFFFLSKTINFLLNPYTWLGIAILFAFFNIKKRNFFIKLSCILFLFFSNSFITDEAIRLWEYPATKNNLITQENTIGIVLGGGMATYDSKLNRLNFMHSTDRILQSIILYKKSKIKKILISGGSGSLLFPENKEAPLLEKFLRIIDIPQRDIIVESKSNNTYENALFTKKTLDSIAIKPDAYLLITSGYHMRRSIACFKKQNIQVIPYSTDRRVGPRRYDIGHLFLPNINNFNKWNMLFHELFGYISYKIVGYI